MTFYQFSSVHYEPTAKKHFQICLDVFLWEEDIKDFVAPDNMSRFPPDVSPLLRMLSTKRDKSFLFKKYSQLLTKNIKVFFSRNILNFLPKKNAVFLLWSRSTQNEIPSTFHLFKTGAIIHWRKLSFSPLHFFKISWPLTSILKIGTNYDEVKCNLFRSTITNLKSSLIWKKYSKYIIGQLKSWKLT